MLGSLTGQADKGLGKSPQWLRPPRRLRQVWHDALVRWRGAQTTILTALTLLALGAGIWHAALTKSDSDPANAAARPHDPSGPSAAYATEDASGSSAVYATVDPAPAGAPLPAGFLGLSLEYSALEAYTGADPAALNPVFIQLLRNLGQPLVLRIGGNTTDATWWPVHGMSRPSGVNYALSGDWLASARALAARLGAKLILGVNLAAGRQRLTAAEAAALVRGVGAGNLAALELGNEPDVYGVFPWYRKHGRPVYARGAGYDLNAFIRELRGSAALLPRVPLAGPATAELPWLAGVPALIAAEPGLRMVSAHRYPIQGCLKDRSSPSYPSIANLLSSRSSTGLAEALAPYVALAHDHRLQFRVDELNSAALAGCLSRSGVSNTFASALWMLDALFNLAGVGVDGVNIHTLPGAAYELFTFRRGPAGWQAFVHSDYYGLLMFAQAFPPRARLLPVHAGAGSLKVWATRGADGRTRVTLINESSRSRRVELQLPFGGDQAELEWLSAPGIAAADGVTLAGQTFGAETDTGRLGGAPTTQRVAQLLGWCSIQLPPYSAALLTR